MNREHITRILCAAEPSGSSEAIDRLLAAGDQHGVDAIAVIGDIGGHNNGDWKVFRALARATCRVFWVPGPGDAPVERYLQEAYNIETAYPLLRGVHGTGAYASGDVVVAGFGGEISDDPHHPRDERTKLCYPRWEAEYRLKVVTEFDYNELMLLFWTPPVHKGLGRPGSDAVAELIGTYRPQLVVCGGERGVEILGRTLTVAPGSLRNGDYAVADLRERTAELHRLTEPVELGRSG